MSGRQNGDVSQALHGEVACEHLTPVLSGAEVRSLMRCHGKTIRGIATERGLTMKRVREVRANGVTGFLAEEWQYLITGEWPSP